MPYPVARYFQALLEGWTVTDPNSRFTSVTDHSGYSSIVVSGGSASGDDIYFTKPIKDYLAGPIRGSGDDTMMVGTRSQFETQPAGEDALLCGLCDNAVPTTGGALNSQKGLRQSPTAGDWVAVNSASAGGYNESAGFTLTLPFVTGPFVIGADSRGNDTDDATLWSDAAPPVLQTIEGKFGGPVGLRAYTHFLVSVYVRGGAQTLDIRPGFFVAPSIGDLVITPRKV